MQIILFLGHGKKNIIEKNELSSLVDKNLIT